MEVTLINSTPNPDRTVAAAARLCYSSDSAVELTDGMSDEKVASLIRTLIAQGHGSALEHAVFTFSIDGISRACANQLVRHRLASYNQRSQRYVTVDTDTEWYATPPSIAEAGSYAVDSYKAAMANAADRYNDLIREGVSKEDARYVLPNSCKTSIVVTMNARELRHFFSLRCCNRAQWEIRLMAWEMLKCAKTVAPLLFADAGPECVRTSCKEGKMSCGNPYKAE